MVYLQIKFTNEQKEIVMKKKCWFVVTVILLVSQFAISAAEIPKKAVKLVKKADAAFQNQEYDKSLEAYNKAIQLAPEYAAAYLGLGRLQAAQKNDAEAVKNLEKAIELDPESAVAKKLYVDVLFQLGSQAISQRQVNQSNGYFSKLIEIPGVDQLIPDIYQKALFHLGTNYYMMRKSEESNKYYLKLAAILGLENVDKKLVIQTNYQIGINYSNMRKPKESIEYLNKLFQYPEFQSEFADAYISVFYVLGINSYSVKDYDKSIEHLSKFLELAKDSSAHNQMIPVAYSYLGSSHFIPLRKEVEKIIEKDQSKAVELAKKKNEIETCLSKAIELSPNDPQMEDAYKDLGLYYYYCEELDKAVDIYKKLIEKYPSSKNLSAYKKFLGSVEKEAESKSKK